MDLDIFGPEIKLGFLGVEIPSLSLSPSELVSVSIFHHLSFAIS